MTEKEALRLEELRKRNREIFEHSGNFTPIDIIESGKAKKYSSKREIAGVIVALVLVVAAAVALILVSGFVFRVKTVQVTNETDFYAEEIIAASGINIGENLIFADKDRIKAEIAASVPYASNITVKKVYPSKIIISLTKGSGKYYVCAGRYYYLLDENCNVIARTNRIEDIELAGCIRIQSEEIAECVVGKRLEYLDADLYDVFDELAYLLEKYGFSGFCSAIIIDSKFDLQFEYKNRFTVKLGDLNDLEIKFQFLEKIVDTLSDTDSGIIDVSDSDLHEATIIQYN